MKLEKVLAKIDDEKVMLSFLKDITTPHELKALQERLDIIVLLNEGIPYTEISKRTRASTTTITRVSRFLKQENYGGYRWVLENLQNFED